MEMDIIVGQNDSSKEQGNSDQQSSGRSRRRGRSSRGSSRRRGPSSQQRQSDDRQPDRQGGRQDDRSSRDRRPADRRPKGRPVEKPKLSVVIPVYNEINTIEEIIRRVRDVDWPKEIVVVDDCSTDGTREVLQKLQGRSSLKVHFNQKNQGKGACLHTGFGMAAGEPGMCR